MQAAKEAVKKRNNVFSQPLFCFTSYNRTSNDMKNDSTPAPLYDDPAFKGRNPAL